METERTEGATTRADMETGRTDFQTGRSEFQTGRSDFQTGRSEFQTERSEKESTNRGGDSEYASPRSGEEDYEEDYEDGAGPGAGDYEDFPMDYKAYEANAYWKLPYRILFVLAEFSGVAYFVWRFVMTLNTGWWSYWYSLALVLSELYFFVTTTLFFLNMWSPLARQISNLDELNPEFPIEEWPSVDVFIPCCREPVEVIRNTMMHSLKMDYPTDKLHVYICDDGKDSKVAEMVKECFSLNSPEVQEFKEFVEVDQDLTYLPTQRIDLLQPMPTARPQNKEALNDPHLRSQGLLTSRGYTRGIEGDGTAPITSRGGLTTREGATTQRGSRVGGETNRQATSRGNATSRGQQTRRGDGGSTQREAFGAPSLVHRTRGMFTFRDNQPEAPSGGTTSRDSAPTTARLEDARAQTARGITTRLRDEGYNLDEHAVGSARVPHSKGGSRPNTSRLATNRGNDGAPVTSRLDSQRSPRDDTSSSEDVDSDADAPVTQGGRRGSDAGSSSSSDEKAGVPKLNLKKKNYPQGNQKAIFTTGRAAGGGNQKKKMLQMITQRDGATENEAFPMEAVGVPDDIPFDDLPALSYVARYKPPGLPHHAKAGNLNNALFNCNSTGDLILILDCDMAPEPHMLKRLLPYFFYWDDEQGGYCWVEELSFVQSPQHFINLPYSDPFAHRNSLFYGPVIEGRDGKGGTPFVGTNAIFRRKALEDIGGIVYGSVTEDMYTSMKLHSRGFTSAYHNEFLAHGLAPEDLPSTAKQRLRWAKGSLQIIFRDFPLSHKGLSAWQRMFYFESSVYPFSGIFIMIFSLTPPVFFFSGTSPTVIPSDYAYLLPVFFLPYFCLNRITLAVAATGINKDDIVRDGQLAWMLSPVWLVAIAEVLSGKKIDFTVTPKDGEVKKWTWLVFPAIFVFIVNVAGIIFACIMYGVNPEYYDQPWVFYASLGFSISVIFLYYNTLKFSFFSPPIPDEDEKYVKKEFEFPWLFVIYTSAIVIFIVTVTIWQIGRWGLRDQD